MNRVGDVMTDKPNILLRIGTFTVERFPPSLNIPLIVTIFFANASVAARVADVPLEYASRSVLVGCVTIVLVFLHLRIFDEIKDYRTDVVVNPARPLPRGLLSVREAKAFAVVVMLIEVVLISFVSRYALHMLGITIGYSLLMYKEFYAREFLSKRLILYTLTHAPVSGIISMTIFTIITGRTLFELAPLYWLIVCANVLLSLLFEFGRKTFAPDEETDVRESYSKNIGVRGAMLLVLGIAAGACAIATLVGFSLQAGVRIPIFFASLWGALLGLGIVLFVLRSPLAGKIFRAGVFGFLFLYYAFMFVGTVWR